MILPNPLCFLSHMDRQLKPVLSFSDLESWDMYGLTLTESELEKWIHRGRHSHTLAFVYKGKQSNRLLVSGGVCWDLVLGPLSINCELLAGSGNPSLGRIVTLNPSDWKRLFLPKTKTWSSLQFLTRTLPLHTSLCQFEGPLWTN